MSRTPAEPTTTDVPSTEPRPRASRAALWGALGSAAAGLAAVGAIIVLAVRAG
ncbi:hypothetical protein [Cellulomonas sp. GbtcB1]|jgi:hypothetical protein|uniref:hypothetical protein n=1 Tax=unclassified Cellulomonas TaxID=2620175 RepID=UPI001C30120C|nr:hypothetical protein [Cellulomonas sp. GbtcB1]